MAKYLTIITYSLCALLFLVGCKGGAEDFFEGRPSEMSLVHNRIIEGSQDSMIDFLMLLMTTFLTGKILSLPGGKYQRREI